MKRSYAITLCAMLCGLLLLAACAQTGPGNGGVYAPAPTSTTASTNATPGPSSPVSRTALPLGDGHVASSPKVGYVDSCQTQFNPNAGGAFRDGPWIHGSTWDATTKIAVQGSVSWPQATFTITRSGSQRILATKDLPVSATTGVYPVAPSDPAYGYDRNPNTIQAQTVRYALPADPQLAAAPACVNMGPIGVLNDGVFLFNALDGEGRDAAAHEALDRCEGHPERTGEYHHHDIPTCMLTSATGPSTLVGYALDGFGIYVERDAQGNLLTNADLDACHGRTSAVRWDGQTVTMYHYVATLEYPYTLGCYMGAPVNHPA
jgi:hypothetical protein